MTATNPTGADDRPTHRAGPGRLPLLVGSSAILFSVVYIVSDLIELATGGFGPVQLGLTYAAEAALPLFVIGLYAVQRPRIGALGLAGAIGYAYSYIAFTATVVYSLVEHTRDWVTLTGRLGPWFTAHGVIMVVAGIGFGLAVLRAGVFPRWTGYALMAGVCLVAATTELPDLVRVLSATVRAAAFIGMGVAALRLPGPAPAPNVRHP